MHFRRQIKATDYTSRRLYVNGLDQEVKCLGKQILWYSFNFLTTILKLYLLYHSKLVYIICASMFEQNNWKNIFDKLFHLFALSDQ